MIQLEVFSREQRGCEGSIAIGDCELLSVSEYPADEVFVRPVKLPSVTRYTSRAGGEGRSSSCAIPTRVWRTVMSSGATWYVR
jgi:hypothetical protein